MRVFTLGIQQLRRTQTAVLAGLVTLVASSCDSSVGESEPVDRIALSPTTGSVQVGGTVTLSAVVLDAAGNAMRDRRIVWSSEDSRLATVNQSGVVVGVAAGSVQIAASSGGKSASAAINVTARPVTLVRVTPGTATISVGSTSTLKAEAFDASSAPVIGLPVGWKSSNEAVATVNNDGDVSGVAPGSATITATIAGRDGTAEITIAPQPVAGVVLATTNDTIVVGGRTTLSAAAVDAQNKPLANRIVTWTSSDPVVANVSSQGE
ncbi:MAG: Ig-like domain-containing protein, partial [Gemmatimonadota bacterium]